MPAGCNSPAMLTEIYIEALLVDEELADQVWAAWDAADIDEATAFLLLWSVAILHFQPCQRDQKATSWSKL